LLKRSTGLLPDFVAGTELKKVRSLNFSYGYEIIAFHNGLHGLSAPEAALLDYF
jgi:hypothetical protein